MEYKDNSKDYQVRSSEYVISAVSPRQYPRPDRPEIAFAGRSNVGKSSLLNRLLNRRKLARTSRTPGRTQTINFFNVNDELYFVDLPGYGYANVPVRVRAAWQPMVDSYLSAERDLRLVALLIDIRREPGQEEIDLIHWLSDRNIPALIIATKADKVSRGQRQARLAAISRGLGVSTTPLIFSSLSGEGRPDIWEVIHHFCAPDPDEAYPDEPDQEEDEI